MSTSEQPAPHLELAAGASELHRRLALGVEALPLAVLLAVVLFMVEREGGFALTVWSPIALLLLAFLAVLATSVGYLYGFGSRATLAAVSCLGGFTLWSFASVTWASVRADAWHGSNRTLLYLVAFVLAACWSITWRAAWPLVLAAGVAVAVAAVITVEQTIHSADPAAYTIDSRLSAPLGYPSATAALFMTFAWLSVGLASRRWVPPAARGVAFGLAGLLGSLSLLGESRGSIFTLPLVAAALLVFVPGRLRSLWSVALVTLGMAPAAGSILGVYSGDPTQLSHLLSNALTRTLVCAVLVALAGWVAATADLRVRVPRRVSRIAAISLIVAGVVAAVFLLAAFKPWGRLDTAWHSFKYGGEPGHATHFGGLGSNRYDFWRVALVEFEHHPVQGIGTDNFLVPYLQLGRSNEEPLYPHSLLFGTLAETGIIGALLFAGFLASTIVAVFRIPCGPTRELAGVLVVGASVFLLHGLVDWLWEMPVLGVLGMTLLGTACGLGRSSEPRGERARGRAWVLPAIVLPVCVVAAAAVTLPWLAARNVQQAVAVWPRQPQTAFATLRRAERLDPLSDRAAVFAGAIAGRLHRYEEMRASYQKAVDRNPVDWYATFELGVAEAAVGRHAQAAHALGRAAELNPREPVVQSAVRAFRAGRKLDPDAIDHAFAVEND